MFLVDTFETMSSQIALQSDVELDEITREVAERELQETPERVAEATNELRKLLKGYYFEKYFSERTLTT
jgi:GTP cyclohydrolase I